MSRRLFSAAFGLALAVTAVTAVADPPRATAATSTYTPVADAYVNSRSASENFGTSSQLGVDGSPVKRTFLRFTVGGLTGSVTGATLRLHVDDVWGAASNTGGALMTMSDTIWSETAVTWNDQPAIDGAVVGSLPRVTRDTWYEIDVTTAIPGDGTFSFAMTSSSGNGADYDSRESGTTSPQLIVTTGPPGSTPSTLPGPTTTSPPAGDQVLVGAGDIAGCGTSGDEATADLLDGIPGTVFTAGDSVYDSGTAAEFANCYDPSWGRHKARTRPSVGNHEYRTADAAGYFDYFGDEAGDPAEGYYSYDLGSWHVVVINSNCSEIGGCGAGSPQETWVREDLAASDKPCTVAYWHHPLFTSGADHSNATEMRPIFEALYDFDAEIVVSGHNHNYERFAPQNPTGGLDTARGIREFVAGTGGRGHYGFAAIQPNSEIRNGNTYGVLQLTLKANSYDWQFVPVAGETFTDSGTEACH
jgi:hypothetical protein